MAGRCRWAAGALEPRAQSPEPHSAGEFKTQMLQNTHHVTPFTALLRGIIMHGRGVGGGDLMVYMVFSGKS